MTEKFPIPSALNMAKRFRTLQEPCKSANCSFALLIRDVSIKRSEDYWEFFNIRHPNIYRSKNIVSARRCMENLLGLENYTGSYDAVFGLLERKKINWERGKTL